MIIGKREKRKNAEIGREREGKDSVASLLLLFTILLLFTCYFFTPVALFLLLLFHVSYLFFFSFLYTRISDYSLITRILRDLLWRNQQI